MSPNSITSMKNACHVLAEHIMRMPAYTNRCKWLREQASELLKSDEAIESYATKYQQEYPYADAPTEYLANILKSYDEEA